MRKDMLRTILKCKQNLHTHKHSHGNNLNTLQNRYAYREKDEGRELELGDESAIPVKNHNEMALKENVRNVLRRNRDF